MRSQLIHTEWRQVEQVALKEGEENVPLLINESHERVCMRTRRSFRPLVARVGHAHRDSYSYTHSHTHTQSNLRREDSGSNSIPIATLPQPSLPPPKQLEHQMYTQ